MREALIVDVEREIMPLMYKCNDCGETMDSEDLDNWYAQSYCCSGHSCSCQGMPVDPPWCIDCERIGCFINTVCKVLERE